MLTRFGRLLYRLRWVILIGALLVSATTAWIGKDVFSVLGSTSIDDPHSQSAQAQELIQSRLNNGEADIVILMSDPPLRPLDQPFAQAATQLMNKLQARPEVLSITSYYSTHDASLLSHDGRETIALVSLSPHGDRQQNYTKLKPLLRSPVLHLEIGGPLASNDQFNTQIKADLARAEMISLPITALLLVVIFSGLLAAALPLLIGLLAIVCSFAVLCGLARVSSVSNFAINVVTFMSVGLAIDYSLFIVTRFREELKLARDDVSGALQRTVATAGRTVLFSGLTVCTSLSALLLFPETLLRSVGLGAISAALVAMVAALTVLPALLAVVGRHINVLSFQQLFRRRTAKRSSGAYKNKFWYRISHFVMHWPAPVSLITLGALLLFGLPLLHVAFSMPDERSLPADQSARVVHERLQSNFPQLNKSQTIIAIRTRGDALSASNLSLLETYVQHIKHIHGVTSVESLVTISPSLSLSDYQQLYAHPSSNAQIAAAAGRYANGNVTRVTVTTSAPDRSTSDEQIVRQIRAIHVASGFVPLVGGNSAQQLDLFANLRTVIPRAALVMGLAIFVLLFLMTGSIILPLKALLLNVLSLAATFGILVWIFQDGYLHQWLDFQSVGSLDSTQPVLIFAIAFGLSVDYEVFLLSRIKEQLVLDSVHEAIVQGLQQTGWLITSAAALLAVVVGVFATSRIILVQEIGVGVALAVVIDATLVRVMLVPALMRMLGRFSWWAPKPLRVLWEWVGLEERTEVPVAPPNKLRKVRLTKVEK